MRCPRLKCHKILKPKQCLIASVGSAPIRKHVPARFSRDCQLMTGLVCHRHLNTLAFLKLNEDDTQIVGSECTFGRDVSRHPCSYPDSDGHQTPASQ